MNPLDPWHLVQLLWGGLIGFIIYSSRRFVSKVDELDRIKADKIDMDRRFAELINTIKGIEVQNTMQHNSNTTRLDRIIEMMPRKIQ